MDRDADRLLGRPGGGPVRRLRYFGPVRSEVEQERIPESYWRHLALNVGRCEEHRQRQPEAAPGAPQPNFAQGRSRSGSRPPRRGAERRDDGSGAPGIPGGDMAEVLSMRHV